MQSSSNNKSSCSHWILISPLYLKILLLKFFSLQHHYLFHQCINTLPDFLITKNFLLPSPPPATIPFLASFHSVINPPTSCPQFASDVLLHTFYYPIPSGPSHPTSVLNLLNSELGHVAFITSLRLQPECPLIWLYFSSSLLWFLHVLLYMYLFPCSSSHSSLEYRKKEISYLVSHITLLT